MIMVSTAYLIQISRRRSTSSFAFQYQAQLDEKITASISTRKDYNSEFKNSETYSLGLIRNINSNLRLRGMYGTAIKNPTFTERFGYYTNFIGNPLLKPEESINFELGLDKKLVKNNSFLSATIFYSSLQEEIDGNFVDPKTFKFTATNKDGSSKRKMMRNIWLKRLIIFSNNF